MNFNLAVGLVWLVFGVVLIVWDATTGGPAPFLRGPYGISPGWIMILLALYNLARWYARPRRKKPDEVHEALRARLRARRERPEPPGPPDPNFMFTDEPSSPPSGRQPPSEQR